MTITVTKSQEIDQLRIEPEAKEQIKEMFKVCQALGGTLTVTPPTEKLEAGRETDYYFAFVTCGRMPKPSRFDEIRLYGSGRLELIGEDWLTMHPPPDSKPSFVVWLTGEPITMRRAYLDNAKGVDIIEGDLRLKAFSAYVQRDGNYVNMEMEMTVV